MTASAALLVGERRRSRWARGLLLAVTLGALAPAAAPAAAGADDGGAPAGTIEVECRDERQLWFDDTRTVAVPADVPEWWLEEVENESASRRTGFEDRGGAEDFATDTANVNAQGCGLAESFPAPEGRRNCQEINALKEQLRPLVEGDAASPEQVAELEQLESASFGIVPDDCWGTYPSDRYTAFWNPGSRLSVGGWADRLTGWLAAFAFGFGKLVIQTSLWMVRVAYTFDFDEYRETMVEMAARVDRDLLHLAGHDFSLISVVWFALLATAGYMALRGRGGRAAAEVLATVVIAGIGTVLLGPMLEPMPEDAEDTAAFAPGGYMDSFGHLLDRSSYAPLLIAHGQNPDTELDRAEVESLLRRTQFTLHREFVEAPASYINWGTEDFSRTPHDGFELSCAEVHNNILQVQSPPRSWPSHYLARHGCLDEAAFNSTMSTARLASVVLVSVIAVTVGVTVALSALALLFAKLLGAILFGLLPLAVMVALLPSKGRKLAWWWVGALVQAWLASLAMGSVLLLLQFGVESIVRSTSAMGLSLAGRWLSLLVVVVVIFLLRKKLMAGTQRIAGDVTHRLTEMTAEGRPGRLWRHPSGAAAGAAAAGGGSAGIGTGAGTGAGGNGGASSARPGGVDLSMVDRAGATAVMVAAGAGVAAAQHGPALVGAATFLPRRVAGEAYDWVDAESDRRKSNTLSQSFRAALSETEDVRSRTAADARAGRDPYTPVSVGSITIPERMMAIPRPVTYKTLPTDEDIARLKMPVNSWRAERHARTGVITAPNNEVLYMPRYSWERRWLPVRRRSRAEPRKVRGINQNWVAVRPPKVLSNAWTGRTIRTPLGPVSRRSPKRGHLATRYSYRNRGPGPP